MVWGIPESYPSASIYATVMEIECLGSNRGFVLLLPNASSAIGGYFCVPELNEGFGVLFVWFVWVFSPQ